jgi:electron transport complex protein RnfD
VVTALLLALTLPPLAPWWIPVLGSFIAIVVAKHLYGGIGYNPFNPAMAAYAVLLISFPLEMSIWSTPQAQLAEPLSFSQHWRYVFTGHLPVSVEFDALSSATLLDHMRTELGQGKSLTQLQQSATFGLFASAGYEWISLGFLAGGLFLLYKKIISWHIPVSLLLALSLISGLCFLIDSEQFANPLIHIFSGAAILGAFFIATDPVTAATTPIGKMIYASGIGLMIFVIRQWGGYPDGVAFAVLLIGLTVPLLDYYTAPKVYGERASYEKS